MRPCEGSASAIAPCHLLPCAPPCCDAKAIISQAPVMCDPCLMWQVGVIRARLVRHVRAGQARSPRLIRLRGAALGSFAEGRNSESRITAPPGQSSRLHSPQVAMMPWLSATIYPNTHFTLSTRYMVDTLTIRLFSSQDKLQGLTLAKILLQLQVKIVRDHHAPNAAKKMSHNPRLSHRIDRPPHPYPLLPRCHLIPTRCSKRNILTK